MKYATFDVNGKFTAAHNAATRPLNPNECVLTDDQFAAWPHYKWDGVSVVSAPLPPKDWKAEVSAKRYAVETAGINFTYRTATVPVSTSRDSQIAIDIARNRVRDNQWAGGVVGGEEQFKFADGVFRPATSTEITEISTAVRGHKKSCMDNEKTKFDEINATGTTDVNTGWPATANTPTTTTFQK